TETEEILLFCHCLIYRTVALATQAAAFSTAKAPATSIFHSRARASLIPTSHLIPKRVGNQVQAATTLALSPTSASGLLLRGGAAADAAVLNNFYGDALGFFGGIRIPASFLAGSSLAAIFTLKNAAKSVTTGDEGGKWTKMESRTIKFYHLASLLAFLLSINTIALATSAHTSIIHGRFDPMAETAYMLMKKEFEYEFVSVRWSFLTSMFCFLGMVTSRMLIEFDLLKEMDDSTKDRSRKDM
ncbi:hypothetical protein ACHAWF_003440, partial [Thalassiosira exigua]